MTHYTSFVEKAVILFSEPKKCLYAYVIDLNIARPSEDNLEIPSLLGRDILDRWRMIYDPSSQNLLFTVHSADEIIRLGRQKR